MSDALFRYFNYYHDRGVGGDRGRIVFNLFGHDYHLNHNEIGDPLGFQTSPDAFTEVPNDKFMQYELDKFWGSITLEAPPNLERLNASLIHNPTIRFVIWFWHKSSLARVIILTL